MTLNGDSGVRRQNRLDLQSFSKTPCSPIHRAIQIDHHAGPEELVTMRFLGPAVQGSQPYLRSIFFDRSVAPIDLLVDGAEIVSCLETDHIVALIATVEDATVFVRTKSDSTLVRVSSANWARAAAIAEEIRAQVPAGGTDGVTVRVWYRTSDRQPPTSRDRDLDAPEWDGIARNYPSRVRDHLAALNAATRPAGHGRFILWHGAPGTGKTTALRALMRSWSRWCASQYIADPERFFGDPGYMADVLSSPVRSGDGPTLERPGRPHSHWKLVIAEDSDEYLRATARRDAGSAMGRLLNLTDGILGQAYRAIVLITTNEELQRLHPALIRPGRCLARVEFALFSPGEAKEWLGLDGHVPDRQHTLAELLALRGDLAAIGPRTNEQPPSTGAYL